MPRDLSEPEIRLACCDAALTRLKRAERRARVAIGSPPAMQEMAKRNLRDAIAVAEEWGLLEAGDFCV